jgi:hypothetical protein
LACAPDQRQRDDRAERTTQQGGIHVRSSPYETAYAAVMMRAANAAEIGALVGGKRLK